MNGIIRKLYALSTELGPLTERIDYLTTADASGGRDLAAAWARLNEISSQQARLHFQWGDLEESTKFLSALHAELSSFLAADSDEKRRRSTQNIENLKAARARTQAKRAEEEKRLAAEEAEREQERLAARSPEARAAQEKAEEDRQAAERAEAVRKAEEERIAAQREEDARTAAEAAARKAAEDRKLQLRKHYDDEMIWAWGDLNKLRIKLDERADEWPDLSIKEIRAGFVDDIKDDLKQANDWRDALEKHSEERKEDGFNDDPEYKAKLISDRNKMVETVSDLASTAQNQIYRALSEQGHYIGREKRYSDGLILGIGRDIIAFFRAGRWVLIASLLSLVIHGTWPFRLAGMPFIAALLTVVFVWNPGFSSISGLVYQVVIKGSDHTGIRYLLDHRLVVSTFLLWLAYPVVCLLFWKKELAAQRRRLDGIWERREAARLARLHAQQEAMFYNYGASAQHVAYGPGGMTINVKTPVTWSEWLRRSYWIWRWIWLLVPAIWLVGGIEPFMQMIAAAIPDVLKVRLNELLEWLQAFLKA